MKLLSNDDGVWFSPLPIFKSTDMKNSHVLIGSYFQAAMYFQQITGKETGGQKASVRFGWGELLFQVL